MLESSDANYSCDPFLLLIVIKSFLSMLSQLYLPKTNKMYSKRVYCMAVVYYARCTVLVAVKDVCHSAWINIELARKEPNVYDEIAYKRLWSWHNLTFMYLTRSQRNGPYILILASLDLEEVNRKPSNRSMNSYFVKGFYSFWYLSRSLTLATRCSKSALTSLVLHCLFLLYTYKIWPVPERDYLFI